MKFFTILICKLLCFVGKLIGKGTSLPGAIALKLQPNILKKLRLPDCVIAVTGSNGKTSTAEMIAKVLTDAGKRVVTNKEGSNQIEGVTTLLLKNATLGGKVKGDVILMESDERYARHTFKHIKPTMFVITNLYRDQMTRNAHPYHIYNIIKDAVDLVPDATLVLNADDPIVRNFGTGRDNVVYFGMERNALSSETTDAVYNDCHYCPNCKAPMEYDYFHYAHLGSYHCTGCGYSRPECTYRVDSMDLEESRITINGTPIHLEFSSKYYVYNLCATYAVTGLLGLDADRTGEVLSRFVMQNGRNVRFTAGKNEGFLICSKHENSTSYNQSLAYFTAQKDPSQLVIIVDAISRKYYTGDISWIWDISFEMLKNANAQKIILSGKFAYDLGLRFQVTDIDPERIIVEPDLNKMGELIRNGEHRVYAVTCFSDKEKLFSQVQVQSPTAK